MQKTVYFAYLMTINALFSALLLSKYTVYNMYFMYGLKARIISSMRSAFALGSWFLIINSFVVAKIHILCTQYVFWCKCYETYAVKPVTHPPIMIHTFHCILRRGPYCRLLASIKYD